MSCVHKGVDIRHTWCFLPCHRLAWINFNQVTGDTQNLIWGYFSWLLLCSAFIPASALTEKQDSHTKCTHFILTQCERKVLKLMRIQQLTVKTLLLPHHRQVVVCYFLSSFTSKLLCYRQTGCDSYIWKKKREWQMCQNNIGKLNSSEKRSSLQRHNQQKKVQLGLCWNFTMSCIKSCDFFFSWSNYFCLCMHQPSWPSSRTLTSLLFI